MKKQKLVTGNNDKIIEIKNKILKIIDENELIGKTTYRTELKKKLETHDKPLSKQLGRLVNQNIISMRVDPNNHTRKIISRGNKKCSGRN